jgi:peptide chain release factor subunit 3
MDEASVRWSKDRYNEILTAIRPFLKNSGYDPDTDCTFLPASGMTGENLIKPVAAGVCNWYKDGRTLFQIIDSLPLPPRDECAPLRIPVLDKMQDRGTVIFGKVESGTIRLGQLLKLHPSGLQCQVQTIYDSKEQCVKYAKPGENVKLRLNIEKEENVNKGEVICLREQTQVPVSELFEAEVDLL